MTYCNSKILERKSVGFTILIFHSNIPSIDMFKCLQNRFTVVILIYNHGQN